MRFDKTLLCKDVVGILLLLLLLLGAASAQQEIYLSHKCSTSSNYTGNGTYRTNLNAALTALSSNTDVAFGYYNLSEGQNGDKVSIRALCRGDISLTACRNCLNFSTSEILQLCPTQKEAIVWYNYCMLQYSNRSISGYSKYPNFAMNGTQNYTTVPLFSEQLSSLLNNLRDEAASGNSTRKFAVGYTNGVNFIRTYALVQCISDLSKLECTQCLDYLFSFISTFVAGSTAGRAYCPSCNFRYQLRQFYEIAPNGSLLVLPPPQPPAPATPSAYPVAPPRGQDGKTTRNIVIIVASAVCFVVLVLCILNMNTNSFNPFKDVREIKSENPLELDFETIRLATDSFSDEKKLGRGGFGAVYKGMFADGQEIAVKRLAADSGQGDTEFKNEVMLVAKLHHTNLVKLIGFCLEGHERLLVYEFMPNGSLDHFLFDSFKRAYLHWERRYAIIQGIAKGLVYLHEDSRLGIIHRDLKASNILLDEEMNPKIADFGMARLMFGVDQKDGVTRRVVGTHGYMAPEYAIRGQFSAKSDVYSFGILVMELVTGQKKSSFCIAGVAENLLNSAWESWTNERVADITDQMISSGPINEITRCLHIGLLCVQESPTARPTMASVVQMLNDSSLSLPAPVKPAVSTHSGLDESGMPSSEERNSFSQNEKENTSRYPIISKIYKDIFVVPASRVASESAFNLGSRVVDPFRVTLTPKMVEGLICLNDWLRGGSFSIYKEPTKTELELYVELEKLYSELIQLVLSLLLLLLRFTGAQTPSPQVYNYHACSGAIDSFQNTSLDQVILSFKTLDQTKNGFHNLSVGIHSQQANSLALCRGDVSESSCLDCIKFGATDLPQRCPAQLEAIVWYDNCMFRYTNVYMFRSVDRTYATLSNHSYSSDTTLLKDQLFTLLKALRDKASSGDSTLKYAVGDTEFTGSQRIYALVQCIPDLDQMQCANCLDRAFRDIMNNIPGKEGGRVLGASCSLRFDTTQFFGIKANSPRLPTEVGRKPNIIIIVVSTVVASLILLAGFYVLWIKCNAKPVENGDEVKRLELQVQFQTIRAAVGNFSDEHKLGQGGFGAVYKGKFVDGQEIAVKRLAQNSGQGDAEFQNEVMLLAKLQHKNLVKLLGFCLQGHERLLIYEYVPNASLDKFLFNTHKRSFLDWETRYKIIKGIARGLLYLHEDSRLRIIHRDLKAGNVLLDANMNPKISDFGMASGYMAPEYVLNGRFSAKSDVYSFGVIIMEMITGQRISSFTVAEVAEDLISFAWESWRNGRIFDIIDPTLKNGPRDEILRSIHIGLLCVQESVTARPNMASVVPMLNGISLSLPLPSWPAYFTPNTISSSSNTSNFGYSIEGWTTSQYYKAENAVVWQSGKIGFEDFIGTLSFQVGGRVRYFCYKRGTAAFRARGFLGLKGNQIGGLGFIRESESSERFQIPSPSLSSERIVRESPDAVYIRGQRIRLLYQGAFGIRHVCYIPGASEGAYNPPFPFNFSSSL
ncbi:unnamed protein product [Rhodiola kirilowii]